jgi:ATP-dependent Clp protease ATP-binding subunit ClpC
MSEYMEKHSVSKLIGSPPGYVGCEDGGILTEKVRRKPYSVVLFDEIEKAHSDINNILLQIFEEGKLTDSRGRTTNFRNTVIILTSNIGAAKITAQNGIGFVKENNSKQDVMKEVQNYFSPELLGRLDEIIVFDELTEIQLNGIAVKMLNNLKNRAAALEISLEFAPEAVKKLADGGTVKSGARKLLHDITVKVENMLSSQILSGSVKKGDNLLLVLENEDLCLKTVQMQ